MNKTNNKKVISKDTKGTNKDNIFKKLLNLFNKNKKVSTSIICLIVLVIIGIIIINNLSINYKVVTINDKTYDNKDFMIYLYSAKYNYFKDSEINKDELNVILDEESNMTVKEYLKNTALNDIKTSAAIIKMADDNNIILDEKDYEDLEKEKDKFIKSIGGKKEFKKILKENKTTELAYDKMSATDKLYQKIIKKLYSEGKVNDLTEEEIKSANESYNNNYIKIKQIILTIIDLETGKNLSSTTINQKEALAKKIVE